MVAKKILIKELKNKFEDICREIEQKYEDIENKEKRMRKLEDQYKRSDIQITEILERREN